jgi:hypothetical protein
MVHEITHVLLPKEGHSTSGLIIGAGLLTIFRLDWRYISGTVPSLLGTVETRGMHSSEQMQS